MMDRTKCTSILRRNLCMIDKAVAFLTDTGGSGHGCASETGPGMILVEWTATLAEIEPWDAT
jgi:hypothetical protein